MFWELFLILWPNGNERSWQSTFGIKPETMEYIWVQYVEKNKHAPTCKPVHLMWVWSFLKLYNTFDALSLFWNASVSSLQEHIWPLLKHLYMYMDEIDNTDRFKAPFVSFGTFESRLVTDGIECPIERPRDRQVQEEFYSGYKCDHTLKYITMTLLETPVLIEVEGSWPGKSDDLTVSFRSQLLEEYLGHEYVCGDAKYRSVECCTCHQNSIRCIIHSYGKV